MTEYPFHTKLWPRSIMHPDEYDGGDALALSWDFGGPIGSAKKKLIETWAAKLPTLQHLKRLSLWSHVTQPLFDAACQIRSLEVLQVKWGNVQDLGAIARLGRLRALYIGSSTRVKSIEPLASLASLQCLVMENFKLISDFSPLTRLRNLQDLSVTGSMWSRQDVGSLEPFATMTWLSELTVDTARVKSLRPLAALKGLKVLGLGGRLPYEEYAWLSAQLPNTQCRWFAAYQELAGSGIGMCKTCGKDSMVMPTGRGKPVLCKNCDAEKLAKHVASFEASRMSALAGSSSE